MNLQNFDDIRPYEDREVGEVIHRLLRNKDFLNFISGWQLPGIYNLLPWGARLMTAIYLRMWLGRVRSISQFQKRVYFVVRKIIEETTDGFVYEGIQDLDPTQSYIFISNHRDIAGDSMLLDYALYESGFDTVRIAVGDNLVQVGFATDLMKLNKSFFIRRSEEGAKKIYAALLQSSQYIHHSLRNGHSIWIAQSEGRAKDGMDITDAAIIKMFALAERKANFDNLIERLNIVPLAISYEYDSCDIAKALELQVTEQEGVYEKPQGEDLENLARGLGGYKGRVVLRVGKPIRGEYGTADAVAKEVDSQIRRNLQLFPINYWALSQLNDPPYNVINARFITDPDDNAPYFEQRLQQCPEKARHHWLRMYANPVVNKYQLWPLRISP
ncbi:MAG: 1-acyl-sn-glycerol-3-phosphate acyltransferase [Gammaproteobacteria bacterium]|nr:1-acyl-sn-glycerol-3-phosphate acyltransferase [Gammaproteobacteria bacterium]